MNRRNLLGSTVASWLTLPVLQAFPAAVAWSVLGKQDDVSDPQKIGAERLAARVKGLPDDGVLALVEGEAVRAEDLISLLYLAIPEEVFGALEQSIRRRLVGREAKRLGVTVSQAAIDRAVDGVIKAQIDGFHATVGPERDFTKYMEQNYGTTPEAYRAIVADVALENLLLERVVRAASRRGERVEIRMIATKDLAKAKEVHGKLVEGASFAALARKESIDRSKEVGGLFPPVPLDPNNPLLAAVKDLEVGKFTDVGSETKAGQTIYWIVRLEARLPKDERPYGDVAKDVETELEGRPLDPFEILLWDQEVRTRHAIDVRLGRA